MIEIKLVIETPDLSKALLRLSDAISGVKNETEQTTTLSVEKPSEGISKAEKEDSVVEVVKEFVKPKEVFTFEQISNAGSELLDAGKMDELMALLSEFNVKAITTLDKALYPAFVARMREIGANI